MTTPPPVEVRCGRVWVLVANMGPYLPQEGVSPHAAESLEGRVRAPQVESVQPHS